MDGDRSDEAVLVVFNPTAGGGRAASYRSALRSALDDHPTTIHWVETERRGHAEALVRQWRSGVDRAVAIGGDGTVHEVVNGLLDVEDGPPSRSSVTLGVVNVGTGGDFGRGIAIPRGWRAQLDLALTATSPPMDVLLVELESMEGRPLRRVCVNVAGAGMNGRVVELANASDKAFGGLATFAWATVRTVVERPIVAAQVEWADEDGRTQRWAGQLAASFFANGPYCGHGMWLGREGSPYDGNLDLTLIPDLPALRMLVNVPRLYDGTLDHVRGVVRARAAEVRVISPDASATVDLDGEVAGRLPLKIRVIPKILPVAAGVSDF